MGDRAGSFHVLPGCTTFQEPLGTQLSGCSLNPVLLGFCEDFIAQVIAHRLGVYLDSP